MSSGTGNIGYSGTPLAEKLGIAEGDRVFVWDAPADYADLVAPLPPRVRLSKGLDSDVDMVHVFVKARVTLERSLRTLRATLRPEAPVWVSWPKRAAKVRTDVTEDVVRAVALPLGFVDIKVCAVDEIWSGLKLVVRRELR
jgi:hypothetical protein